jgi:hypothetical protein
MDVRSDGDLLTSAEWSKAEDAAVTALRDTSRQLESKEVRGIVHGAMLRAAELARGERQGAAGFSAEELSGTRSESVLGQVGEGEEFPEAS